MLRRYVYTLSTQISAFSRRAITSRQAGPSYPTIHTMSENHVFHCDEEPHMVPTPIAPGYMPLKLGDELKDGDGRIALTVVRKLGWGENSSVWLARYPEKPSGEAFVAVKILTRLASSLIGKANWELEVLTRLRGLAKYSSHPGLEYCTQASDCFISQSRHGELLCIVFLPHGPSIKNLVGDVRDDEGRLILSSDMVRNIVGQTLKGISCLHDLKIVHTDVKMSNILLAIDDALPTLHHYIANHPSTSYPLRYEPKLSPDPIYTARSQPLPPLGFTSIENIRVCLSDFGAAIPIEEAHKTQHIMPTILRAPEVILGLAWDYSVDIWAIGCLTFELLTGEHIFKLSSKDDCDKEHLKQMNELLGPFPPLFLSQCNQDMLQGLELQDLPGNLKDRLALSRSVPKAELDQITGFIQHAMSVNPSSRPSAHDLLKEGWLVEQ